MQPCWQLLRLAVKLATLAKMASLQFGSIGRRVAKNLEELRRHRRLTQADLSGLLKRLGRPMSPETLSKMERPSRRIDVDDLVALAVALDTTPNRLLLPGNVSGEELVELTPEVRVSALDAWKWATGDETLDRRSVPLPPDRQILIRDDRERLFTRENRPHNVPDPFFHNVGHDVRAHPELVRMIASVVTRAKENELDLGRLIRLVEEVDRWRLFGSLDDALTRLYQPQRQPVVAAIVTSAQGVLVGRRNDRTPPWGFISGEIEPGELPEDAAVREVKEETGLEVRAGQVVGERDHPATGRHMIYMAAKPTRGTDVFVGDEAELAEVRWVGLAEADELLPGMFGPVREYLAVTIGAGSGS
jgi:8-oxo-dGTP diphosphatase